ncbi:hypothetical protein CR513_01206, partial [Mucuna pruriens]
MKLIELGGLDAIISTFKTGKMEAKENRDLIKREIYPLLVDFLNTSSVTAKAKAAAFIGDLSMSTPKLTVVPKPTGCWHIKSAVC